MVVWITLVVIVIMQLSERRVLSEEDQKQLQQVG